ncbi:MAG: hypothetical protein ACKO9V_01440, partial [Candidatus Kapaibacterium sp.]
MFGEDDLLEVITHSHVTTPCRRQHIERLDKRRRCTWLRTAMQHAIGMRCGHLDPGKNEKHAIGQAQGKGLEAVTDTARQRIVAAHEKGNVRTKVFGNPMQIDDRAW